MANSNFIVQNGLQVGSLTIFAGNGDIKTGGNLTSTGSAPAAFSSNITVPNTNGALISAAGTNANVIIDPDGTGTVIVSANLLVSYASGATGLGQGSIVTPGAASFGGNVYVGGNLIVTGNTTQINNTINNSVVGNLLIGPGLSFVASQANIQYSGIQNNYLQMQMQNLSAGTVASTDYVATANNGSDSDTYIDFGINGSNYVPSGSFAYSWPNDGYLYVYGNTTTKGGNLMLATMNTSNTIFLAVGGQSGTNIVANVASTGVLPGANTSYNLGSTTGYWNNAYINALTATGITVNTGKLLPGANAIVDIGSTTGWFNNIYGTATHALYADLAENYLADRTYHAGTVLMFGGDAEVTMADADTKRVAGVVSTNPAHLMNGALQGAYVTPLALMGRVPCQVIGPIAKGDLLVSAGWGYAKSNNDAATGQVIGKALEDFPQQVKGVIEVVVGRV